MFGYYQDDEQLMSQRVITMNEIRNTIDSKRIKLSTISHNPSMKKYNSSNEKLNQSKITKLSWQSQEMNILEGLNNHL